MLAPGRTDTLHEAPQRADAGVGRTLHAQPTVHNARDHTAQGPGHSAARRKLCNASEGPRATAKPES